MAPGCFGGFCCFRRPPSLSDDAIVSPVSAPTGVNTQPDSGSPSDNKGIRNATAVEATRPGTSPGPGHVEIPVPAPSQDSLPTGTGVLAPALTDVQPTGPHCPEGNVDVPVLAQAEGVPSGSPSSRPPIRMDPAKAKKHIDRIRRFRILVMGRANAGKTTILQRVCNTTDRPEIFDGKGKKVDATVVRGSLARGHHNIEDELVFTSNPGFVFHDSCGFESGSVEEFDMVMKFVRDRAKTTKLDERIHAIWFCIPLNESHRMIMAAEKKFFDECDTGHVPVIVLLTKADALSLEAVGELHDQGISISDAMKGAAELATKKLDDCLKKVKDRLNKERFPPKDYLALTGLHQEGAKCTPLLACTANALKEEGLRQLLTSTQQSNLELCMEFAIMKSLKRCMEEQDYQIQPASLAFYMSLWFPFKYDEELLYRFLDLERFRLDDDLFYGRDEVLEDLLEELEEVNLAVDNDLIDHISLPRQFLTIPTLSSSMQYSRQHIAEHGLGSILVFEYLYFLLQVQDGRNGLQESLTLAVKEYQSSGIHAKVNESIQTAFEQYGDNMDDLCPILVQIAKENQLSMISTRKG